MADERMADTRCCRRRERPTEWLPSPKSKSAEKRDDEREMMRRVMVRKRDGERELGERERERNGGEREREEEDENREREREMKEEAQREEKR